MFREMGLIPGLRSLWLGWQTRLRLQFRRSAKLSRAVETLPTHKSYSLLRSLLTPV
jgi:hypothetical protein